MQPQLWGRSWWRLRPSWLLLSGLLSFPLSPPPLAILLCLSPRLVSGLFAMRAPLARRPTDHELGQPQAGARAQNQQSLLTCPRATWCAVSLMSVQLC